MQKTFKNVSYVHQGCILFYKKYSNIVKYDYNLSFL